MADSFIYCFTHGTSVATDSQLTEKLQDLSQAAASNPPKGAKGRCLSVGAGVVLECVVSESHVVLLLEGGTLRRVRYSEEQLKEKNEEPTPSHASRSSSPRSEVNDDVNRVPSSSLSWGVVLGEGGGALGAGSSYASGVSRLATRSRMLLRRRGGGRGLTSRWPLVPASDVPDSLINQAMAVLQGKSREAVIRELQRTNLDVNQAVNNLLSRDDDDGGDGEGSEGDPLIPAAFFPSGDELLSLLGSVGAVGPGEEDMEEGAGPGRPVREGGPRGDEGMREEIAGRLSRAVLDELGGEPLVLPGEAVGTRGEGGSGGRERREEGKKRKVGGGGKSTRKDTLPTPVFFEAESPLVLGGAAPPFTHITSLHSELVAVDTEGALWRWAWKNAIVEPHPLVRELGLVGESVRLLSGKQLRVSVVTDSGKLASWLDWSVSPVAKLVEHSAYTPSELAGDSVVQLVSSHLFSAVLTASHKIYWWGLLPFPERKQAVVDVQERLRGSGRFSGSSSSEGGEVQLDSLVCLRSSPIYTAGTKAIYCRGHRLQCGILQESVFSCSMSEKCRFRVVTARDEPVETEPSEGSKRTGEEGGATPTPHLGVKRHYRDDGAGGREEQWSLHDVIFTDRVQSVRVGRVVKIDGLFAAVHFPGRREGVRREGGEGEEKMEEGEEGGVLGRCRLLRKDDLVLATESLTRKVPHYRQDNLARLRGPAPSDTPLVVCCGSQGVHALFSSRHQLFHVNFSLSGRVTQSSPFSQLSSHYFLHQATPTQLLPIATNQWLIRDKLGGVHLTSVNAASAMKDPLPLNLPPVTAMATGQCSSRTGVVVVAWQQQRLIPVLLRKDVSGLKTILSSTSKDDMQSLLLEHTSGGCNILHILSLLGRPPTPSRSSSAFTSGGVGDRRRGMAARTTPRSGVLREIMKQAMALASSSASSHGLDSSEAGPWGSDEGESDSSSPPPPPLSSSISAPSVVSLCLGQLGLVLTEPPSPLSSLLTERNVEGYTPFMAAVSYKAYQVAMQLLDLALSTADGDQSKLMAALYPSDCHPDDNPIFVLCRNDNCSFTWTGEMHIHQDIFVCRSCGLTDSLCCCTECAYTCHRGHDCVFKKASPTAYCDCWERCNCRCLPQTPDSTRLALLQKLMNSTALANKFDGSHQSLLAALLTMTSHQSRAQSHWSMIRSSSLHSRSRHEDMPVHNLRPPKFAPKALAAVVEDWQCVKSAVLCTSVGGASSSDHTHQLSSVPVDSMVYLLLAKQTGQGTLSSILSTIVKHITRGSPEERAEAVGVASCFLRSVVRVWSVCELESSNIPSPVPSSRPRPSVSKSGVGERAYFIFSSLALHAVPALLETALQVITPVTRGMARPIDPLSMTDRHKVVEEMFRLPPVSLLREQPMELSEQGGEGVSGDESEAGDGEESVAGVGGQDASSTATIGSNLLYLSDEQDSTDNDDVESDASLPAEHYHDDEDVVLEHPSQRLRLLGRRGGHWALPSAPPTSTTPSSSTSRFSRSSRRAGRSVGTSASLLAQTFSLIVRQIAVVLETTFDIRELPVPPFQLSVSHGDSDMLTSQVWARLEPVWVWLATNMDSVEVLVRRGNNISERAPFRNHGRGKAGEGGAGSDALEGRRETFSYLLTILREAGPESSGLIPAIDVAGMDHLAWTLDALHYLLETTRPSCEATPTSEDGVARTSLFFRRSKSTSCLGSLPASPFDPLHEALPLAEKPHLLDASYNKQHLFGFDKSSVLEVWPSCDLQAPPILSLISHPLPRGQGSTVPRKQTDPAHLMGCRVVGVNSHELAASVLLGRWATTVDLFGRVFGETVGRLPDSFLAQERGFKSREREFRRDMDALHSSTHNELSLLVERPRDKLLLGVLQQLQAMCDSRHSSSPSTSLPPLCVYRFKVVFENEPGEGSGVLRSLFTAFADAVLSEEPLPRLETLTQPLKTSLSYSGAGFKGKSSRDRSKGSRSLPHPLQPSVIKQAGKVSASPPEVEPALFYQPGKAGFYSLVQATPTPERLQAFRGVGRMIGLGLLLSEVFPVSLCRHILKFIMMREVAWHDLAFFDPAMYESLRKLIVESEGEGGGDRLANMGLTFQVSLSGEEGGGGEPCELVPGGASQPVTPDNVYQYVKLYAELRMVGVCHEALVSLRGGVYDVIPEGALGPLSPEDLRLILCGCHSIDTDRLRVITVFEDESKKEEEVLTKFKGWFWSVVERLSVRERQELLYFWTSSPALPANTESYQPSPSITIRPPDDARLPTANTCISRLYIPLYSSRSLLRTRLLTALKTKTFGFV